MITNVNEKCSVFNNTKRRHVQKYYCDFFKEIEECYLSKNPNTEHVTFKSSESKIEIFKVSLKDISKKLSDRLNIYIYM
jgi:hypothetical protein